MKISPAVVLALLLTLASPHMVFAADRSLHLHAASHGGGRVTASAAAEPRRKSQGSAARKSGPQHGSKSARGTGSAKGTAHPSKSAPSEKAHSKASRRRHREPEVVDDPITVHRAGAKATSRKAAARERLLARRGEREAQSSRHLAPIVLANSRRAIEPPSRWTVHDNKSSENESVRAARSIMLAGSEEGARDAARYSASTPRTTTSRQLAAAPQGESHPDDDGEISTLQTASASPAPRSVVVRSPRSFEGEASAAPVSVTSAPARRLVTGFGAEVAAAPGSNAAPRASSQTTQQQEQMDLADDTETEKASPATPRTLADDAMQPMVLPMYTRSGRLVMPAPLKGSREILVHQNTMADRDGLERIRDDRELNRLLLARTLVGFPVGASLRVNSGLPENRRYARPWTVRFVADAARAFYAQFGEPLQVNSAVRTVSYQRRLQRVNGNAAATSGDGASPHLTGQAVDLAKRGMTADEIGWMRSFLTPFIDAGKIDVEEEFQQACFHISVYRAYMPMPRKPALPKIQVAQLHATEPKVERSLPAMLPTGEADNEQ